MADKMKKKKNKAVHRTELVIMCILLILLLAIPVCSVYTKAILSNSNIALEDLRSDIKEQEKINESLKMEISELASLDTIQDVVIENDLTYKSGNIKVVTNE